MEFKTAPSGELQANTGKREVEGHASLFDVVDDGGDRTRRGAFVSSIGRYGPAGTRRAGRIKDFWVHREAVGRIRHLAEDSVGLHYVAVLDKTQRGNETLEQVESGTLDGSSIGYNPVKTARDEEERHPKTGQPVRDLLEVDLIEISQVPIGMLDLADSRMVKLGLALAGELPADEVLEALDIVTRWAKSLTSNGESKDDEGGASEDTSEGASQGELLHNAFVQFAIMSNKSVSEVRREVGRAAGLAPRVLCDVEQGEVLLPVASCEAVEKALNLAPGALESLGAVKVLGADGGATADALFWAHNALRRAEALAATGEGQ